MIPKKIHFCWFGGNPLPEDAKKCIASWKKYFPDYEIKRWDETNFNVNICAYTQEAYKAKKWAFVSDYARFWILYNYGGLYFDTDVEVIKDMRPLINKGPFMGEEAGVNSQAVIGANPGLGLAATPEMSLYREILDYYDHIHYMDADGDLSELTVVDHTTNVLRRHGFKGDGNIEEIEGVLIYPAQYFCPMNYYTGDIKITDDTYSIHHYTATWHSSLEKKLMKILNCDRESHPLKYKIRLVMAIPLRFANKIQNIGVKNSMKLVLSKIRGRGYQKKR